MLKLMDGLKLGTVLFHSRMLNCNHRHLGLLLCLPQTSKISPFTRLWNLSEGGHMYMCIQPRTILHHDSIIDFVLNSHNSNQDNVL